MPIAAATCGGRGTSGLPAVAGPGGIGASLLLHGTPSIRAPDARLTVRSSRSVKGRQTMAAASASTGSQPLVVVGSANADLVVSVGRLPLPGETLAAQDFNTFPGGKGANQATAAGRLDYPTSFIGQFGRDGSGAMLRDSLAANSVDCSASRDTDAPTGTALILLQPSGENSIVIVGGANQANWEISDSMKQAISGAGTVLLQREIPEEVNTEVAKIAKDAGVPVVLDAGGKEGDIGNGLLACVTTLSPNETELARITGMPTDTEEQITQAARLLFERGVQMLLVKLGSKGSLLLRGEGQAPVRQQAFPVDKVVDTTGAGDCFTAAWAVGRLIGQSPQEAMVFASAAAAICVQGLGATTSLPTREQVDQFLAASR